MLSLISLLAAGFFLKGSLGRAFSHRERKRVEKKAREGGMAGWGRRRAAPMSRPILLYAKY